MTFTRLILAACLTAAGTSVSAAPLSAPACIAGSDTATHDVMSSHAGRVWDVSFAAAPQALQRADAVAISSLVAPGALAVSADAARPSDDEAQATRPRAKAYEYSDAYRVRLKIHKIASIATIPLFVTETILGQKLYNFSGGDGVRSAHQAIATTLGVLFGVNTVTGVWNLVEGRHDPNRKTKVLVHSIMMLGADAGFTISGLMAPSRHNLDNYQDRFAPHRAIALTSMAVATTAYLIMIFGK